MLLLVLEDRSGLGEVLVLQLVGVVRLPTLKQLRVSQVVPLDGVEVEQERVALVDGAVVPRPFKHEINDTLTGQVRLHLDAERLAVVGVDVAVPSTGLRGESPAGEALD